MIARLWTATAAEMVRIVFEHFPRGRVWSREPSGRLYAWVQGLADEMLRVHLSATGLMDEADPQTTTDLLDEWERVCGLPDCAQDVPPPVTDADRRLAIVAKLAAQGGQSAGYFAALALALGVVATITEPIAGFPQVWEVSSSESTAFRAGTGRAGDRLVTFTDLGKRLRCMYEKYKPAHTRIWWT